MQLGNVLTFCMTSITKKIVIKTKTKTNIMHKNVFKGRKQVFRKKPKNIVTPKNQQTKKTSVSLKKLTKNIITQKNQQKKKKQILKNQQTKK
jgi:hypothetical protein